VAAGSAGLKRIASVCRTIMGAVTMAARASSTPDAVSIRTPAPDQSMARAGHPSRIGSPAASRPR
jgi:hypothetical protein